MSTERLSRAAWIEGAIKLAAEVGLPRVGVEPLAKRLGATKGSFYWHFENRQDLINGLLDYWESASTQSVIAAVERDGGEDRLGKLLTVVFAAHEYEAAEWAILRAVDDPVVAAAADRVHQARLGYLERLYKSAGSTKKQATARARLAYAAYLGNLHLSAAAGRPLSPTDRKAFLAEIAPSLA